jgi:hypothetical protein
MRCSAGWTTERLKITPLVGTLPNSNPALQHRPDADAPNLGFIVIAWHEPVRPFP